MADIGNVVNVALLPEGKLVAKDNMSVVACFTSEMGNVLSSDNRTSLYKNLSSVGEDFGTTSKMYDFAKVFFAQSPNAVQFGGYLVAAYWRAASETVPAKAGILTGSQINEANVISTLRAISDGSFTVAVDSVVQNVTALDFRTIGSVADIVTILNGATTGCVVSYDDNRLIVTSDTTGATSEVSFLSAYTSGTFVGDVLLLSDGSGAVSVDGVASVVLTVETKETALNEALKEVSFVSFGFIDAPSDVERAGLSTWAKANNKIGADVVTGISSLEKDVDNVVWANVLSSGTNYRYIHSKANNRKLWIAYLSRAVSVNFNAENSANTMQLKSLSGVSAEIYTDGEVSKAYNVGLDIFTTIKDVPVILTSPANDFFDNVFNLIAYVNAVQVDTFNLLKQTATKIAQTQKGVDTIVGIVEKTTRGFVRAGVFAPGTWSSPDFFGDIDVFNRNIEQLGFYVKAGSLAKQSQVDRQLRKSPVIQVAAKNAGAIHSVDVIINFNI